VLTARAIVQSVATEFPASEAPEAQKALRELWDDPLYAVLPTALEMSLPTAIPLDACAFGAGEDDPTASAKRPAPAATRLTLDNITPPAGTNVQRNTTLVANLHYEVRDFEQDRFFVMAQFDTDIDSRTTDGTFENYPVLKTASGQLRFCFPLANIWDDPRVKRPLKVRFWLNRKLSESESRSITGTAPFVYPVEEPHPTR
jgi:hypothetical protein